MKDYTFTNKDIGLIKTLLVNTPRRIWWNFFDYTFEYPDYFLTLLAESLEADSINNTDERSDEAIVPCLQRTEGPYAPDGQSVTVCINKRIQNIWVVNSILSFTELKFDKQEEIVSHKLDYDETIPASGENIIKKALPITIGGYEELLYHPKSAIVKTLDSNNYNILSVGLLIELEEKLLPAFVQNNAYCFPFLENNFLIEPKSLEEFSNYEFIPIANYMY